MTQATIPQIVNAHRELSLNNSPVLDSGEPNPVSIATALLRSFAMDPNGELPHVKATMHEVARFTKTATNLWFNTERRLKDEPGYYTQRNILLSAFEKIVDMLNEAELVHSFHRFEPSIVAGLQMCESGQWTKDQALLSIQASLNNFFYSDRTPWTLARSKVIKREEDELSGSYLLRLRYEALKQHRAALINESERKITTIALDFDGTTSTDQEAWKKFVKAFRERGHKVFIVTMRYDSELDDVRSCGLSVRQEWSHLVDGIITTGRKAKRRYCIDIAGINPDIWIDDRPMAIYQDAEVVFGGMSPPGMCVNELPEGPRLEINGKLLDDSEESVDVLMRFADISGIDRRAFLRHVYDPRLHARYEARLLQEACQA